MDDITTKHHPHEPENPRVAFEHGDADVYSVSKYGIGLAFGIVIAAAAMWWLFDYFMARTKSAETATDIPRVFLQERQGQLPPSPRLQATPKLDLREFRQAEDAWLSSYGWTDQSKGLARMPIEQAIDLIAQKGLPSRPDPKASNGLDAQGYRLMPEDSSSGRTEEKVAQ
jgi:hypothetical protein